ncbi:hypothetical protein [Maribellus sp. YY47]|uniref:hypothetical protein n=1 Tax=Maribellus sp. YY47 TaxID=2929486 RepID=UPI002001AE7A|nr:hypothetical protein [Maribellus sp. YY47]MCK3682796.1 hypothetical protein [Maribellus sp. YY47]
MTIQFNTSEGSIRKISERKKYWFVRTYSGATFDDFQENNYIGIGLNFVPQNLIQNVQGDNLSIPYDTLKTFIANNSDYEKGEVTKWANQLVAFQHDMQIGDCVIIPSKNSDFLAIGEIESEVYITDDTRRFEFNDNYEPYPEKRRRVNWILLKKKEDFRGDLDNIFHSRQAIYNIDRLAQTIEGYISPLFMIGDTSYMVIQIRQDENINAFAFSKFLDSLTYFYTEICEEHGIEYNEELYIKIKVQSKGKVALAAVALLGLLGISTIFALSDDPRIKLDLGRYGTLEAEGDGLLQSWTNFLNAKQERQQKMIEFQASMDSIKAATHNDLDDELLDDAQEEREGENR